jgi:hypothetical protein
MSAPIPRRLLPHSAKYKPYTGTVGSVKQYGTEVDLEHVRLEPVKQNAMTSLGDMKNDRVAVFYDCVNSRPAGLVFKTGDVITFDSVAYTVRKASPVYGMGQAVHHWEVACV